jgi:basic membrane protein A
VSLFAFDRDVQHARADVKPARRGAGSEFTNRSASSLRRAKVQAETIVDFATSEPTGVTQGGRRSATSPKGYNPVVAVLRLDLRNQKVAAEFPTPVRHRRLRRRSAERRSIVYKEEEGSYLVGVLAGMASKTGKVGFVGGMDIPLIRKFECGYEQGARAAKADIQVFQNMTGTTGAAWNDPVRGGELTKNQIDQGADVIYAAAGATGLGVLQTAADNGKLSIGVDSNQNHLHPGSVLTSISLSISPPTTPMPI